MSTGGAKEKPRRKSTLKVFGSKSKIKRNVGSSPQLERRESGEARTGGAKSATSFSSSSSSLPVGGDVTQLQSWEMLPDEDGVVATSEECDYRIIPPHFHALIPTSESYIMASRIKCPSENIKTFVLTRHSVYKLVRSGDDLEVQGRWDLMELYRVGGFPKNPAKKVHFHVRSLRVPEEINKKVKVLGFGVGEASWDCIRKKEYICETVTERIDWVWAITQLSVERWQYYFEVERAMIPSPEIYQTHYFCSELIKKKLCYRYIVISSHSVYNLEVRPNKRRIEIVKTRWVLPAKELVQVITYPRTDNRAISVLVNPSCSLVRHKSIKEELTFIMNSENERNDFKIELKRVYVKQKKERLSEAIREES